MIKFKNPERDMTLILAMNPILISLLYGCVEPVFQRVVPDYNITVTRTIDEKIPGVSVSNTHAEGRAVDLRCRDLSKEHAKEIEADLNMILSENFGAISQSTNKPKFAVLEDIGGSNCHFHLQIRPNLSMDLIHKLITRGLIYSHTNPNICKI